MASSHVWSHGQGGRPEAHASGLDYWLHYRYCVVAQSHGCDADWLDTACIPEDRGLRLEAMGQINNIFRDSKLTVICDKDLIAIDVTDLSVELKRNLTVCNSS